MYLRSFRHPRAAVKTPWRRRARSPWPLTRPWPPSGRDVPQGQVAGGFSHEEQRHPVGEPAELLGRRRLVAQPGEDVFDERMLDDVDGHDAARIPQRGRRVARFLTATRFAV